MSNENPSTFIVLTIDGLNAFMLGLYGNTMLETPAFDQIASNGITFDFALSHSCELDESMRHLLRAGDGGYVSHSVAGQSTFVTDCPIAATCAQEAQFETIVDMEVDRDVDQRIAAEVGETQAATFFSTALQNVEQLQTGDLLWLHFSGLSQSWDAPQDGRKQYESPDDPPAYVSAKPPNQPFDAELDDPDLLVSIQAAMTAQVAIIDQLIGVFSKFVAEHPVASNAHLAITSPRGYSLGGGGRIGIGTSLTSESVHVPLLLSLSGDHQDFTNVRSHSLIQNSLVGELIHLLTGGRRELLGPFLARYCAVFTDDQCEPIFLEGKNERAMQNRFWKLIRHREDDGQESWRLFVKPDDRWDANNVGSRCPQILEELKESF